MPSRFFLIEMKRLICSWKFIFGTFGVLILFIVTQRYNIYMDAIEAYTPYWIFANAAMYLALLPSCASFSGDWESRIFIQHSLRTGINRYAWLKLLSMQTCIFLCCVIGKLMIITYVCLVYPMQVEGLYEPNEYAYRFMGFLINDNKPILFMLFQVVRNVVGYLLVGTAASLLSVLWVHKMIAYVTPLFVVYIWEYLLTIPQKLDIDYAVGTAIQYTSYISGGDSRYWLILAGGTIITVALGWLYVIGIRRRVRNA